MVMFINVIAKSYFHNNDYHRIVVKVSFSARYLFIQDYERY